MNGRFYDPRLGRFLSPDNFVQLPDFTQNFNRYSYCLNNPLVYTDPDGEFWHIVIGAVIGGVINLATNWNNVDGFWEGLAVFGAGAGSGALTAAFGPLGSLGGGALAGATNNLIAQTEKNFSGFNKVNWGQVALSSGIGGVAGIAGYGAGSWAANNLGGIVVNGFQINSQSVWAQSIYGTIGGAGGGYAGGFTGAFIMTGDFKTAHQAGLSGMRFGAAIGVGTGFTGGLYYAKENKLNPWTGKPKNSVTIGEGMYRVDHATKDLGNSNINKDWPADMDAYYDKPSRMTNPNAMEFNGQWIENQINNEMYIYDIGTSKGGAITSPYYNLEVGRTMIYPKVIPVKYIHYKHTIRILIISR